MASLLYCLPFGSNWLQTDDYSINKTLNGKLRDLQEDRSVIVLIGEDRCGKTQLLFQAAVSYASQDYNITFISRHPLSHIPLPVHGMVRPETAGQLETLTFLYMNTAKDVIQYCSSVHAKSVLPDVIIVDDFQYYSSQLNEPSQEVGCALLTAQLIDAATFTQSKNSKGGAGVLMIGCNSKNTLMQTVCKQFNLGTANITSTSEDGREEYRMSVTTCKNKLMISYTIQDLGLFLKSVTFEDLGDVT